MTLSKYWYKICTEELYIFVNYTSIILFKTEDFYPNKEPRKG